LIEPGKLGFFIWLNYKNILIDEKIFQKTMDKMFQVVLTFTYRENNRRSEMKNNYRVVGDDVIEIELRGGEKCLIDLEDLNKVSDAIGDYYWYLNEDNYVLGGNPSQRMHRVIMDTPEGLVVDHLNHVRWDNRKSNLRNCTRSENAQNRTTNEKLIELGMLPEPQPDETEPLLNNDGVMKLLGISRQTLYNYRKKGMPHVKLSERLIRYRRDDVLRWMNSQNKED
jgi:predicted DNA-binding transcriptional regulator AlpA